MNPLAVVPQCTVHQVRFIEQHLDKRPEARTHLKWQFQIPCRLHLLHPQSFPLVFRVVATLAKRTTARIPTCSVFSLPRKAESEIPKSG